MEEAKEFLKEIGMPRAQLSDICCLSLLALAGLKPEMKWNEAINKWIRIHDIIAFVNEFYGKQYAENSRETFRKQAMHHFRTAALIEDNREATNSPNYRYRLTEEVLQLLRNFGLQSWDENISKFMINHEKLIDTYESKKKMTMMPVHINDSDLKFSPGKHNQLQKAIIEEFAPGARCLYVGDTIKKDLVRNTDKLHQLGIEITLHGKMPDVILYRADKNWIYFIESVTSVGPISPKRIIEISEMTKKVTAGKIFVTAFPDFATYKRFSESLAWDTEAWIADRPEHMIHMNGDKFMGPRK